MAARQTDNGVGLVIVISNDRLSKLRNKFSTNITKILTQLGGYIPVAV